MAGRRSSTARRFGLERGQSLEGPETRKLRAAAFAARLLFEPAVREGSAAGRQRARTGDLTRDAAAASRGRPFPQQRRRKARLARAAIPPTAAAQVSRGRADRQLIAVAAEVARRHGYPDIRAFVIARTQAGASMAAPPDCTRTGSLATSATSIPRRLKQPGSEPRNGPTSAGFRHCGSLAITTSPPTFGNGTSSSIRA